MVSRTFIVNTRLIAVALGVHLSTVARELRLAVAWLNEHLEATE
jgi:IS30 family transposase